MSEPISSERQAELQSYLDRWQAEIDHGNRAGPYDGVRLTGADVEWLAEQSGRDESGFVENLHLEGANLREADLEGAKLLGVHLERSDLFAARLVHANLFAAHLEGAVLLSADLRGVNLVAAHLEGSDLNLANLQYADLSEARLERASLSEANLEGASLESAYLDSATRLDAVALEGAKLSGVHWGGANLAAIDWSDVRVLGEELDARRRRSVDGRRKPAAERRRQFADAVRTYRVLTSVLVDQGLEADAARFSYRANVIQRKALFVERRLGSYAFSWILNSLAGYGYRPGRLLLWYIGVVGVFMGLYMLTGQVYSPHVRWDEALVLSVSSFHGRGFFPQTITLGDPFAHLAALEAVIGVFIEAGLIATLQKALFG